MGRLSQSAWMLLPVGLLAGALIGGAGPASGEPDADGVARYELENGLKVRLRPVPGAEKVAVLVLYDVGEAHDPEGQSGLGHLVEHCYVTSAAGETPVRTAEAMMAAYPQAWNAQTGNDYTVIAFVAPRADLAKELAEAAARMGDLRVTEEDLAREKPRMVLELGNMYGRIPMLAAINQARAVALPAAPGARKGGVEAQIEGTSLEDVTRHHRKYYKPRNARLILAGGFEPDEARALVKEHFGSLPRGERLPAPRAPAPPRRDVETRVALADAMPGAPAYVCLARIPPSPEQPAYRAFLLLLRRLFQAQMTAGAAGPRVTFAPLDAPEVVFLHAPVPAGGSPAEALERVRAMVTEAAARTLTPVDGMQTAQFFAYQLATWPLPAAALGTNVYGAAFSVGRREQLRLDGKKLGPELIRVTDAELKQAAASLLDRSRGADVIVAPAQAPKPPR